MEKVTVQIKRPSISWEHCDKVEHPFDNWAEVVKFAYRLALQLGKEVRVEKNTSGHYFTPDCASEYLGYKKLTK